MMDAPVRITDNLTEEEAMKQFMELLRECVAAVAENRAAEVDLDREVEGRDVVRITIRREQYRISS